MSTDFHICRLHNDRLAFLCDRCGRVHFHGNVAGHRSSHCKATSSVVLGEHYTEYNVSLTYMKPGFLDENEAKKMQKIVSIASDMIGQVDRFLRIADIDSETTARRELSDAKIALARLTQEFEGKPNPFEELVDQTQYIDDEEDLVQ